MISLYLPVMKNAGEWLSASGSVPEKLLRQLAAVLHLPVSETGGTAPVALITDFMPDGFVEEERPQYKLPCRLCRNQSSGQWALIPGENEKLHQMALAGALHLALLRQAGIGNALVMHGALLYIPSQNAGVILFGESGMGKTSAAQRFKKQGGEIFADDRLLITLDGNGSPIARGLPTWSRFPEPAMPFERAIPVRGVYMLFRGKDDEIESAPLPNWQIAFYQSVWDTCFAPRWLLTAEQRKPLLSTRYPLMEKLGTEYGHYQICGDLNGKIFDHISALIS